MNLTSTRKIVPVEVGCLDLEDGTLVLTAPARWSDWLARRDAVRVKAEPSFGWAMSLHRALPRAELYTAFLVSFGQPNDVFDDYKQSFCWCLDLTLDVGRLMRADAPGPTLELVARASDLKGATQIDLYWPRGAPSNAAALTSDVYDRLLDRIGYMVGFQIGFLEAQRRLPDWSLRCPESRHRFGCKDGLFFDADPEQ